MRREDDEARNLTQLNGVNAIFQTGTALRHIPVNVTLGMRSRCLVRAVTGSPAASYQTASSSCFCLFCLFVCFVFLFLFSCFCLSSDLFEALLLCCFLTDYHISAQVKALMPTTTFL